MNEKRHSFWPGIVLIIIGAVILIHKMDILRFGWYELYPLLLLGLGIWFFVKVFVKKQIGSAFPGSLFLLLGLFFLLRNFDILDLGFYYDIWPIFLLILGVSFVVQYIFKPQDWGLLIPAGIFLFFGFGYLARNMHWHRLFPFEMTRLLEQYWPLALILIGIGIIVSNLRNQSRLSK